METPWEKKTNKVFWRGATTGGGSTPPGAVARYQRHRCVSLTLLLFFLLHFALDFDALFSLSFLRMTSDLTANNRTVVFANPPDSKNYVEANVAMQDLNDRIMDVAFVKAVGCTHYPAGGCDGMRLDHRFADPVHLGENWRHKYLIDVCSSFLSTS